MGRESGPGPEVTGMMPSKDDLNAIRGKLEKGGGIAKGVWIKRSSGEYVQGNIIWMSEDGLQIKVTFPRSEKDGSLGNKTVDTMTYLDWQKDNPDTKPVNVGE
ncbi:MAG: hypothetical protein Q7S66_00910 [bacterium]|nr:hypothetical protein [bacterium]